jgi:hypothetical protein
VRAIALHDGEIVAHGGFNLGPQSTEDLIAPLAAAYTSLPAARFETVFEERGVVLRSAVVHGRRWRYALNATPDAREIPAGRFGRTGTLKLEPWDLKIGKPDSGLP